MKFSCINGIAFISHEYQLGLFTNFTLYFGMCQFNTNYINIEQAKYFEILISKKEKKEEKEKEKFIFMYIYFEISRNFEIAKYYLYK